MDKTTNVYGRRKAKRTIHIRFPCDHTSVPVGLQSLCVTAGFFAIIDYR
jgi:hypothetical protein